MRRGQNTETEVVNKMEKDISYGECHCGCGGKTKFQSRSNARLGIKKGDPNKYCPGHNPPQHGEKHSQWKGGNRKTAKGYNTILMPEHQRSCSNGYVLEHIVIAEKMIGGPLPPGAVVHHTDNNKGRTDKYGIVICKNRAEHQTIHRKMIALKECGNEDWRKCSGCHEYDDVANMKKHKKNYYHADCYNKYHREWAAKKNA